MATTYTVRELLAKEIDIDVVDDIDCSIYIAFCGPQKLTAEGEAHFAPVMNIECKVFDDEILLCVDDDTEDGWKKNHKLLHQLFYGAAGYMAEDKYKLYFAEED